VASEDGKIRAFIAVELTEEVRRAVESAQAALRHRVASGVRWVAPETMHLTLKFLGEVSAAQVDAVSGAMHRVARSHAPFQVSLNAVGAFPNRQAPRVLWLDLRDGLQAVSELAGSLEGAVEPLGFPREGRPFRAHLTLGRVREGASPTTRQLLSAALQPPTAVPGAAMRVESISLIRSVLRPEGPEYTPLHEVRLGAVPG